MRSASAANAKRAVWRLDLRLALVLRAGNVSEAAFRGLDSDAASAFVGIVDKLVEADARGGSDTKVAAVVKTQVRLAGASRVDRLFGMNGATSRKCARHSPASLRLYRASVPDGLRVRSRRSQCEHTGQNKCSDPTLDMHPEIPPSVPGLTNACDNASVGASQPMATIGPRLAFGPTNRLAVRALGLIRGRGLLLGCHTTLPCLPVTFVTGRHLRARLRSTQIKKNRKTEETMRVVNEVAKTALLAALWLTVSGIIVLIAGFVASALL